MPVIQVLTAIAAPPERCFDLARNVEVHTAGQAASRERAVAGVTQGLLELGDEVTWEATHFAVRQRLTARITEYERPWYFVDEMVRGAFERFRHLHRFEPCDGGTRMRDEFDYTAPLGALGQLADVVFLEAYMRRLLVTRCAYIKQQAERGGAGS